MLSELSPFDRLQVQELVDTDTVFGLEALRRIQFDVAQALLERVDFHVVIDQLQHVQVGCYQHGFDALLAGLHGQARP